MAKKRDSVTVNTPVGPIELGIDPSTQVPDLVSLVHQEADPDQIVISDEHSGKDYMVDTNTLMSMRIRKLHKYAVLPEYKTTGSAGLDLFVYLTDSYPLAPGEIVLFPTGIQVEIPEGFEGQVRPRSGLGGRGICIPNSPGTIDSDYRGEVKVPLMNLSKETYTVRPGDRIAQLVISQFERVMVVESDELSTTVRGEGGFGSTGR